MEIQFHYKNNGRVDVKIIDENGREAQVEVFLTDIIGSLASQHAEDFVFYLQAASTQLGMMYWEQKYSQVKGGYPSHPEAERLENLFRELAGKVHKVKENHNIYPFDEIE